MAGASVELRRASRRFQIGSQEIWAVRDIDLSISPGEFLALIGRSGSGKTTLLNLIAGLDRPTTGTVELDGQRVDSASEGELTELRRHKLGVIFQSFGLLPLLSAQENVELPLRIAGYGHSERTKRAREVLDLVALGRRADHRPYELSGGEQQSVAIARALAASPALLLADEPTGELDSATATAIFGLLKDVARSEGVTIVTCTHDPLVMELASRIEELADGQLVTGDGQVRTHVLRRGRSVFRAPTEGGERSGLSTLIGGDASLVKTGDEASEEQLEGEAAELGPGEDEPAVETESDTDDSAAQPEEEKDISRWSRPQSPGS